jgi:VIT1/CCC1 family predicted Fe2+/Mn2+ transporter
VELAGLSRAKGLTPELAQEVAEQLTKHDALAAHAETELGINPEDLASPWNAAIASCIAFSVGAVLPLLAIVLPPTSARVPVTVVCVLLALTLTGCISARLGGSKPVPAIVRNVVGGALAMAVTYIVGTMLHTSVH